MINLKGAVISAARSPKTAPPMVPSAPMSPPMEYSTFGDFRDPVMVTDAPMPLYSALTPDRRNPGAA